MTKEKYYKIISYLKEIIKDSEFENHLFCVGGCVRDETMNQSIKDIDVVLDIKDGGLKFAEWLFEKGYLTHPPVLYPTYGTSMFNLKEFPEDELEAVQTRKEQYKDKDSRNPETEYGTIEEDAFRRDLTINALYWNVSKDELIDPTGKGIEDIKNHIIRVTNPNPDIVFVDDPLRILRVCRFSSRYGWDITDETYHSMKKNVDRLSIISQERITDEFNKMMTCDNPVMALNLIKNIGAMKYVIPEIEETYDMTQNSYHFGTVWEHTLKTVEETTSNDITLRVSALLHDIGKIMCRTIDDRGKVHFYEHENYSADLCEMILKRMKYPNDFIKKVCKLVKNHMRTKAWTDNCSHMKDKSLRKMWYELGNDMDICLNLIHADNVSHASDHCMPNQVHLIKKRLQELKDNGEDMVAYKLPVDGNDVMEVLGIPPGSEIKECMKWLMKMAFNNPNISREMMLKQIKQFKKR